MMLSHNIQVGEHNDARLPNVFAESVALSKTIINCSNHGFMLKTYRTCTFSSWKYTFQIMIVNSDLLLVPNVFDPFATFRNWRSHLTSLRILRRVANE
jgi:hypothetical protein